MSVRLARNPRSQSPEPAFKLAGMRTFGILVPDRLPPHTRANQYVPGRVNQVRFRGVSNCANCFIDTP